MFVIKRLSRRDAIVVLKQHHTQRPRVPMKHARMSHKAYLSPKYIFLDIKINQLIPRINLPLFMKSIV